MDKLFSYTKLFTILLTLFYILGLCSYFYHHEILFCAIAFIFLILITIFSEFDFKKVLLLYLIFFIGFLRAKGSCNLDNQLNNINQNNVAVIGRVVSSKQNTNRPDRIKFYLKAKNIFFSDRKIDTNTKILINIDSSQKDNIKIGDFIELKGKLTTPQAPNNPHQFNYQKYLLNHDTKNVFFANKDSLLIIKYNELSKNLEDDWYFILNKFENKRDEIISKHSKYIKSPRLEILGGIVFGDEAIEVENQTKDDFKKAGLLHLLAASGLNVALIFGIWWYIASLCRFPYNLSILFGAIFVILYTFMTGFPPSILRASIMLLFVLLGKIINTKADSLALIFFVGFLILLFNPKMLFDVGFQLSFMVTIGLIVSIEPLINKFEILDKRFVEKNKNKNDILKYFLYIFKPSNLAMTFAIPFVAQIWVVPLQMHYFNNFTPFSLLANIAIVPFVGILSFVGFMSSIMALIPKIGDTFIHLFDITINPLLGFLINISQFFSGFKYSLINTFGLNIFQIFLFWIIIIILTINIKNDFKNKKEKLIALLVLVVFLLSFIKPTYLRGNIELVNFDVEQSNSILIKSPKNKYILIDCAMKPQKGFDTTNTIVNKYLRNERILNIDTLVILNESSKSEKDAVEEIIKTNKIKNIYRINQNKEKQIYFESDFNIEKIDNTDNLAITYFNKDSKILILNSDTDEEKIKKFTPELIILTYKVNYDFNKFNKYRVLTSAKDGFSKIEINRNETKYYLYNGVEEKLLPFRPILNNQKKEGNNEEELFIDDYIVKLIEKSKKIKKPDLYFYRR